MTAFDIEKQRFLKQRGENYKAGNSLVRKQLVNRIIRYADDFVIVCNDENQLKIVQKNVSAFLSTRGLKINDTKCKVIV